MPYVTNPSDGTQIYFEDDGGSGIPVVLYGGFLDSIVDLRESHLAGSLPPDEFRRVYVDHRGLGRSDKPRGIDAYRMPVRVGDAVAVLDALGIERAHCVGLSWGGRLVFGIAEHAPDRVRSIVAIGQHPLAWPDSPLTRAVMDGVEAARSGGGALAVVDALERFWGVRFPAPTRERWLRNDPIALADGFRAAVTEGPVSGDLGAWRVPCLICLGSGDADFLDGARQAAAEIPGARLVLLAGADHYGAHVSEDAALVAAVLEHLRRAG